MLSEGFGAGIPAPRPKPPALRRSSRQNEAPPTASPTDRQPLSDDTVTTESNASRRTPTKSSSSDRHTATAPSDPTSKRVGATLDQDLDLDLPSDVTEVLQQNIKRWTQGRRQSEAGGHARDASDFAKAQAVVVGPNDVTPPASDDRGDRDAIDAQPPLSGGQRDVARSRHEGDDQPGHHWVGDLPREELEALLMEANRVIQERERDLGIAAAIGQALLEKNMSLRQKHQGIMSRLSTQASLAGLAESAASQQQTNSPPTTDYDADSIHDDRDERHHATGLVGDDDDATPRPTPGMPSSDYFAGLPGTELGSSSQSRSDLVSAFEHHQKRASSPDWTPKENGRLRSLESSPAQSIVDFGAGGARRGHRHTTSTSSQSAAAAAAAAAEAQRQLESLSEQNDHLLNQLAELQTEAETAKRSGHKRLRQLHKEIDGLRAELDAATRRNDELEGSRGSGAGKFSPLPPKRSPWAAGRRTEAARVARNDVSRPIFIQRSPARGDHGHRTSQDGGMESEQKTGGATTDDEDVADAHSVRSASEASVTARRRRSRDGRTYDEDVAFDPEAPADERELVQQLLTKIKELEETNCALAQAGTEMDGRIGRFLEEGERIRDAYDAVESAHAPASPDGASALGGSPSRGEASDFASGAGISPSSSLYGLSPAARRRRAPGNRYVIEGRRTVRNAMRRELREAASLARALTEAGVPRSVTLDSLVSSKTSSTQSSLSSGRRSSLRPRILITPSMEDMAAQHDVDGLSAAISAAASPSGSPLARHHAQLTAERAASSANNSLDPELARYMRPRTSRVLRRITSEASMLGGTPTRRSASKSSSALFVDSPRGRFGTGREQLSPSPSLESGRLDPSESSDAVALRQSTRTLGSELGSDFGGEDGGAGEAEREEGELRLSDLDARWRGAGGGGGLGQRRLSSQQQRLPMAVAQHRSFSTRRLRHAASASSVKALSDAGSDVADLKWSVSDHAAAAAAAAAAAGASAHRSAAAIAWEDAGAEGATAAGQLVPISHDADSEEANIDVELLRKLAADDDGDWPQPDDSLVSRGALRDQGITGHEAESYELLEAVTRRRPVFWADDDDYGQPITEAEARRLGLMAPKEAKAKLGRRLLGWRLGRLGSQLVLRRKRVPRTSGSSRHADAHSASAAASASAVTPVAQLESAEQVEERQRLTQQLLLKRVAALKARLRSGQLSPGRAVSMGLGELADLNDDDEYGYDDGLTHGSAAADREATRRAFAMSPSMSRRSMYRRNRFADEAEVGGSSTRAQGKRRAVAPEQGPSTTTRRARDADGRYHASDDEDDEQGDVSEEQPWRRSAGGGSGVPPHLERHRGGVGASSSRALVRTTTRTTTKTTEWHDDGFDGASASDDDEAFELLDLDDAKRRPGRRGTDYYPVSLRARYRPRMVKERVKVASSEAVTWATAWMSFSAIMVFAFLVAFTRGPKRVLGPSNT